ncbi:MAG: hypothetical protein KC800_31305 [Candidatus Eremiobacteraeota bacterium]|nr:hypothetical protein [Candidatus Eremiobacteraeota bacterium]
MTVECRAGVHSRRLLLVVTLLAFLVAMDTLLLAGRTEFATSELPELSPGRLIGTPVRRLGNTGIILSPKGSESEERMLVKQLSGRHLLIVKYEPTWPEYAGWALVGAFGLTFFWLCFSMVSEEWTKERSNYIVKGKLTTLAALYFTYAVAAWLGWVWMRAWPFWLMGFAILGFGQVVHKLPTLENRIRKFKSTPSNHLWVQKH